MKKIIKSAFVVLTVGIIAAGASYSFFGDEEKSTGNTFSAGQIDLQVDNTTQYNGLVCTDGHWKCEPWADVKIDENQKKRKDGSAVLADRSDVGSILGAAESSGNPDDGTPITGSFYSLGFGGKVVVKFDNVILNGTGNDLKVYEVTGGAYPEEKAKIEVSQDGTTWADTVPAEITRDGEVDLGSLAWAKYVRVTDTSNASLFTNDADGYDLDAIKALNCGNDSDLTEESCTNMTWSLANLENGVQKFFNFSDIKPGDNGEDTVSLHVSDNDAWGRLKIDVTKDEDNTCTDPENEAESDCAPNHQGELRKNLDFSVWLDEGITPGFQGKSDPGEGDNRLGDNEPILITPGEINAPGEIHNIWPGLAAAYANHSCTDPTGKTAGVCQGLAADGHMVASATYYFGMGWVLPGEVGNEVQTDVFQGDIAFEVEQYRNNPNPFQP